MDILKNILAIIGVLTIFLIFIKLIFEVIPNLKGIKAQIWSTISKYFKHKKLEKQAIASNIESVVNSIVTEIKNELPAGWIRKASIEWVNEENYKKLEENDTIIRMRPLASQDLNLMNGVFFYFTKVLFPGTKEVIPDTIRKSVVLQISRRTLNKKHPYVVKIFENQFIEAAIKLDSTVLEYIGKFDNIDQKGFFTSTFLREAHNLADKVRYTELRTRLEDELKNMLSHIQNFVSLSPHVPEELWHRIGEANSYSFLLVARPFHPTTKSYIRRANERYSRRIQRIYVMGVNQEKHFFKQVIKAISKGTKYKLLELFELNKDYRGEQGGLSAIFDLNLIEEETEQRVEDFFNNSNDNNA